MAGDTTRALVGARPVPGALRLLVDALQPAVERLREALLLETRELGDAGPLLHELRVDGAHQLRDGPRHLPEEGLHETEEPPVPHRPAHDPPEHVAPPLVRGRDLVRHQERRRARVVGDHAHGHVVLLPGAVRLPAPALDVGDERPEEIRVEVRGLPLDDGGDPLEAHASVDRGLGERREPARGVAVELHEHEVPDLEPPVALARGPEAPAPGRLLGAREMVALVEVDLRAGPAGPRVSHRPEVVLLPQAQDPVLRNVRLPELERLVVVGEDRGAEPSGRNGQVAGQELPGVGDGLGLEVVAEGEVPQHLEERVVAGRAPDVLQIVVLAARPHALLAGRGPDVLATLVSEEDRLELDHPGVREQERRIVGGNER